MTRGAALGAALMQLLLSACHPDTTPAADPPRPFADHGLREVSGIAPSRRHPGVFWHITDSGNPAVLFASDTTGRPLGRWRLATRNVDWEEVAVGPCGPGTCIHVFDTGDNLLRRATIAVVRLPEPSLDPAIGSEPPLRVERAELRLAGGAADIEAAYVTAGGDAILIAKDGDRSGRHAVYRAPASIWTAAPDSAGSIRIERAGVIDLAAAGRRSRVTAAALREDGAAVAVRTLDDVWLFSADAYGRPMGAPKRCRMNRLQVQGEGIAWLEDGRLALTSEGQGNIPANVAVRDCGPPPR